MEDINTHLLFTVPTSQVMSQFSLLWLTFSSTTLTPALTYGVTRFLTE